MKNRNFLTLLDFSTEEINALIDLAADLKSKKKAGIPHRLCEGKNIALIFEKTSTRTRCAFEVAAADLGMTAVYLVSAAYADSHPVCGLGSGLLGGGSGNPDPDEPGEPDEPVEPDQPDEPAEPDQPADDQPEES